MSLIIDPDLSEVLCEAENNDLHILIDHITDQGKGRLALSSDVCEKLVEAKKKNQISGEIRFLIAEELHRFGGNTIMNIFRGGRGVPYREIVTDVASHLKAPYSDKNSCEQIELAILMKVLEQSIEKMTEDEKMDFFAQFGRDYTRGAGPAVMAALIASIKFSGFAAYKLAAVVANSAAKAILGRGLTFGATGGMMRGISAFAGPIGWGLTAIWTAYDLASPAYRVTVPCVIQIAYMRQKMLSKSCPHCHAPVVSTAKFCNECGGRINGVNLLLN